MRNDALHLSDGHNPAVNPSIFLFTNEMSSSALLTGRNKSSPGMPPETIQDAAQNQILSDAPCSVLLNTTLASCLFHRKNRNRIETMLRIALEKANRSMGKNRKSRFRLLLKGQKETDLENVAF